MAKRYLFFLVVSALVVLAVFSCTTNAPAPTVKPGQVKSIAVKVRLPELAGKVDPSVKAGFYEELKVEKFTIIIENAQRRVEKDIFVFKRTGLDYEFTYAFSGAEVLEAGVYDITIEAYPEKVGRYQGIDRPIMSKKLSNYLLQAGDPTVITDPSSDKVSLQWAYSGNIRINITFDDSVDATGAYYISAANLTGLATSIQPTIIPPATTATFTTRGATPGVYNLTVDATVLARSVDPSDIIWANRYEKIPVSITVFPVVDATAVVKFGPENSPATDLAVRLGFELRRQDLAPGVANLVTSPAVRGNYLFVTHRDEADNATLTVYDTTSWASTNHTLAVGTATYVTSPLVEASGSNFAVYVGLNDKNNSHQGRLLQIEYRPTETQRFVIRQSYVFPQEGGASVKLVNDKELASLDHFILCVVQRGSGNYSIRAIHKQNWDQPTIVSRDLGEGSAPTSPLTYGTNRAYVARDNTIWRLTFLEGNVTIDATGLRNPLGQLRNLAMVGNEIYVVSSQGDIRKILQATEGNWNSIIVTASGLQGTVNTDPVVTSSGEIFLGGNDSGKGYLWSSTKGRILTVADDITSTPLIGDNGRIYVATNNSDNDYNFVYEIDVNDLYVYRIWRVTAPFLSSPTLAGNKLVVFANTGSPSRFTVDTNASGLAQGWTKYRGTLDNSARRE